MYKILFAIVTGLSLMITISIINDSTIAPDIQIAPLYAEEEGSEHTGGHSGGSGGHSGGGGGGGHGGGKHKGANPDCPYQDGSGAGGFGPGKAGGGRHGRAGAHDTPGEGHDDHDSGHEEALVSNVTFSGGGPGGESYIIDGPGNWHLETKVFNRR